jgi:hypothetical protein
MNKEPTRTTRRHLRATRRGATNWMLVDALTDQQIEAAISDGADAAPLLDEEFWREADLVLPDDWKDRLTLRPDGKC